MDALLPMERATLLQPVGYLGSFLSVLADAGVLRGWVWPGEVLLLPAGLLASPGHGTRWMCMLVAVPGALLSDAAGEAWGKRLGPQ